MKKTNIIYWIVTGIFCAGMGMSGIMTFLPNPQQDAMLAELQLPLYLMQLVSVAKLLGVVALLVPGFAKIKEWAYAGFSFDLIGAMWCIYSTKGLVPDLGFILVFIIFLIASYYLYSKKMATE
jgi:uncharacterized membrane protein YphA (DoxX/SURF4 family)